MAMTRIINPNITTILSAAAKSAEVIGDDYMKDLYSMVGHDEQEAFGADMICAL